MRKRFAVLVAGAMVVFSGVASAQDQAASRPSWGIRDAIGLSPGREMGFPTSVSLSISKDIYGGEDRSFTARIDLAMLGDSRRQSNAVASIEALFRPAGWERRAYAFGGLASGGRETGSIVVGSGLDFVLRSMPLFAELRGYADPGIVLFRVGFRH
jgi:hypothetical protein